MSKPNAERALKDNEAKAVARMLHVSPQKLNLVAGLIRGKKVVNALAELTFSQKAHFPRRQEGARERHCQRGKQP